MENFLEFYRHIPEKINPVALKIGPLPFHWYSLAYIFGFIAVYLLLKWRLKKESGIFNLDKLENFFIYAILGLLIGARIGYVLFYDFNYFAAHPLEIINPFSEENFVGIRGMSYFGGLVGVILAGLIFARRNKIDFWRLSDFVVPAIPAGYFFGRIGNFLNGELYGKVTGKFWGMHFPGGNAWLLRHPPQLYEAFFEGLVLFLILWSLRNKSKFSGQLLIFYLMGYAFLRFWIEFLREPDPQIGLIGFLSLGQIFSILLFLTAAGLLIKKSATNRFASY